MKSILISRSDFISEIEKIEIVKFVNDLKQNIKFSNNHISNISTKLNGNSFMYDLTESEISKYLSDFQSIGIPLIDLSDIFFTIKDRISNSIGISKSNVFLQILDQECGGEIPPHYDSSNVSVLSENYNIYIDGIPFEIKEGDLYCFESSLYKHWTNKFSRRRIILSYGFGLKYDELERSKNDPRVRMSERIQKYFQK